MKILFFTKEDQEFRRPDNVIENDGPDEMTLEFAGTTMANAERDDEKNFTVYTADGHFYITFTKDDVVKLASLLSLVELMNVKKDTIVRMVRECGGIDTVMPAFQTIVIDMLKGEGWL